MNYPPPKGWGFIFGTPNQVPHFWITETPLGVRRRGFSALSTAGTHKYTGNVSLKALALVRVIGQIVRAAGVGVFISLCGFSGALGV